MFVGMSLWVCCTEVCVCVRVRVCDICLVWGAGDREGVALQLSPALGELCKPGQSLPLQQPQDPDVGGFLWPD